MKVRWRLALSCLSLSGCGWRHRCTKFHGKQRWWGSVCNSCKVLTHQLFTWCHLLLYTWDPGRHRSFQTIWSLPMTNKLNANEGHERLPETGDHHVLWIPDMRLIYNRDRWITPYWWQWSNWITLALSPLSASYSLTVRIGTCGTCSVWIACLSQTVISSE